MDRERRTHPLRQHLAQEFHLSERAYSFQIADVFPEDPFEPFPLPAPEGPLTSGEERLGESPHPEEVVDLCPLSFEDEFRRIRGEMEVCGLPGSDFAQAEGMEAIVVVTTQERVASPTVDVQAGAPGHDNLFTSLPGVPDTFDQTLPARVLVQFIEDDQIRFGFPVLVQNRLAMPPVIPVEVGRSPGPRSDHPGERGLPHLPGTPDEDHLLLEVIDDQLFQIPL